MDPASQQSTVCVRGLRRVSAVWTLDPGTVHAPDPQMRDVRRAPRHHAGSCVGRASIHLSLFVSVCMCPGPGMTDCRMLKAECTACAV
jgi:hypothetical protein